MQPFEYINLFSPGVRILTIAAIALCAHFIVRALKQLTQLLVSPKTGVGVSASESFARRYPKLATSTTILVSALTFIIYFLALGLTPEIIFAGQGEEIFKAQRCDSCHKPETGKVNPSLKEIAQAYEGKEDQLINYLNNEGESIIKPEKGKIMKKYLEKTKALSVEERKALADFMMGK